MKLMLKIADPPAVLITWLNRDPTGDVVGQDQYDFYMRQAPEAVPYLNAEEQRAWVLFNCLTHPGHDDLPTGGSVSAAVGGASVVVPLPAELYRHLEGLRRLGEQAASQREKIVAQAQSDAQLGRQTVSFSVSAEAARLEAVVKESARSAEEAAGRRFTQLDLLLITELGRLRKVVIWAAALGILFCAVWNFVLLYLIRTGQVFR